MKNYFQGWHGAPYHLSVGAVVVTDQNQIICHHFTEIAGHKEIYLLMRETVELNETLEAALDRGLREEFGLTAMLHTFLGPIISHYPDNGLLIEKVTLYFLMKAAGSHPAGRLSDDPESGSSIERLSADELKEKMKDQFNRTNRTDIDESLAIDRAVAYLKQ